MVADVRTSPTLSFTTPRVPFRQDAKLPDRVSYVSADGERFLAPPPARGPQLQQLTIFDRHGAPVQKVGDPGLYSGPSFSPDGTRLRVLRSDLQSGQTDLWTMTSPAAHTLGSRTTPSRGSVRSGRGTGSASISRHSGTATVRSIGDSRTEAASRSWCSATHLARLSRPVTFPRMEGPGCATRAASSWLYRRPAIRRHARESSSYARNILKGVGRLSPDARFMAFRSDEAQPERAEVYIRPFDASKMQPGEGKWRVSKDGVMAMLHWRADGKEIFFPGPESRVQ